MKLELNLVSKTNPVAEMKLGVDCTADELAIILSDPMYQEIGKALVALVAKLSDRQANHANHDKANGNDRGNHQAMQDGLNHLRHTVEAQHRAQAGQVETLQSLVMSLRRKIDDLSRN